MEQRAKPSSDRAGECRQCASFCDKLIEPAGCIEGGCKFLYTYDDSLSGARYMGCMNKVFSVEIDIDLFDAIQRSRGGFGGVKMTGSPLPHCPFTVERSYEQAGPGYECVNPRFADCSDTGPNALRVLDLRDLAA